jgi:hypothetical protein
MRLRLQEKLEEELARSDLRWGEADQKNERLIHLRLAAQKIADQLSEVEEMEAKLELLLVADRTHDKDSQ